MTALPLLTPTRTSETTARVARQATKRISLRQAQNLVDAVAFAREIDTPLNAHATIHWVGTKAGDDPDGRRFAKVREGFDKWLKRKTVPGGLTCVWVRDFRVVRQRWSIAICFSTWRT